MIKMRTACLQPSFYDINVLAIYVRLRPLKGAVLAKKKSLSETIKRSIQGKQYILPNEGSLICPTGRSMILLTKKQTEKVELSGQTWSSASIRRPASTFSENAPWPHSGGSSTTSQSKLQTLIAVD